MTIALNDLMFVHSGGASNTTPANDIGGAISTAGGKRIKSQNASSLVNITGVVINDAFGNPEGVGVLTFTKSTNTIAWKPYGGSALNGQACNSSASYLLGASSGYLLITTTIGSYPASDKLDTISISNILENLFDHVTAGQALAGKTSYRCFYLLNSSGSQTANNVVLWFTQNTPGGDTMYIGLGTAAINATEQTIGNELTEPAGINWVAPSTKVTGLAVGTLGPGQYKSLWQRRVVPVETRGTVLSNSAILAVSAT